jgi:hypothetical protein
MNGKCDDVVGARTSHASRSGTFPFQHTSLEVSRVVHPVLRLRHSLTSERGSVTQTGKERMMVTGLGCDFKESMVGDGEVSGRLNNE